MRVRAAVCHRFGAPLESEEVVLRHLGPNEVLVRMTACAVCHSDVSYIDGEWGGVLPAVYGHEAAGVVEETGREVTGLAPNDAVVVTLVRSCGCCERCRSGQPTLCEGLPPVDADPVLTAADGTHLHQGMRTAAFAEAVLVDASQVVAVEPTIPAASACLLACGVLTGVGAVLNSARVSEGSTVVVLGVGGVGLNCVQGALLAGAERVIAVDLVPKKLELARAFGAHETVTAATVNTAEAVRELTASRGADYVFVAAGVSRLIELGAVLLRRGGTLAIVGLPPSGTSIALDPVAIADGSLRIVGSKMGASLPRVDIPRLAALYRTGSLKLDELVAARYDFDHINDAVDATREGAQLRSVVIF